MKKFAFALVFGLMFAFTACGPTAKELEDQRIADSIRVADSMAMVQAAQQHTIDSIAKFKEDSLAADSVKKLSVKKVVVKKSK
jgi:hypothetical protein